ncbi:MAG: hypothetical protein O3C65_03625 [Proteobacteria bacterium]|nr:hypothetical protein [Pseudomonadota bacterium]MDA1057754.1 hypothetical protein [Pseudomonadota bacterium]
MGFSFEIDSKRRTVEVTLAGELGFARLIEGIQQLIDDPGFDPQFDMIADCSNAELTNMAPNLIDSISDIAQSAHGGRRAVIAPPGAGAHAVAHYVGLHPDGLIRQFANRDEAARWLSEPVD